MGITHEFIAVTESIPFADLYIHPLNPRAEAPEGEIDTLAANIRDLGLIQNLAGLRDTEGRIGIVAGGRRLRALARLQDDPRFAFVPVKLAPDADTAAVWAAAENHARADLHPADEIREYAALRDRGATLAGIAIACGVTQAHVKRRLRLADLPEAVLSALRADKIGLTEASAFVVCEDDALAIDLLARVINAPGQYSAESIKRILKQGAARDTDRRARFVGVPAYRAAGGRISSDLFGGEVYLDDTDILDEVFAQRLGEVAEEARRLGGWKWTRTSTETNAWAIPNDLEAVVLYPAEGVLSEVESARHDELAARLESGEASEAETAELDRLTAILDGDHTPEQKAHAGVVFYVAYDGELRATPAMVLPENQPGAAAAGIIEAARIVSKGDGDETAQDAPSAPALSGALLEDLRAIRRGARQNAALAAPDLLLALLAFHLNSESCAGRGFSLQRFAVSVTPTTATGYAPDPRLLDTQTGRSTASDVPRAFKAFQKKGAAHIHAVLTLELTRLLDLRETGDGALAKLFDKTAAVNMRDVWTPTAENFFKRAPGDYLDALWCEMNGAEPDSAEARAFAKAKKGEKAARLETMFDPATELPADQRARVAAWLPPEI